MSEAPFFLLQTTAPTSSAPFDFRLSLVRLLNCAPHHVAPCSNPPGHPSLLQIRPRPFSWASQQGETQPCLLDHSPLLSGLMCVVLDLVPISGPLHLLFPLPAVQLPNFSSAFFSEARLSGYFPPSGLLGCYLPLGQEGPCWQVSLFAIVPRPMCPP